MKLELAGQKILLTQAHLVRYMGSEIVTLELAEFFVSEGAEVVVVTHAIGSPVADDIVAIDGVTVFSLDDPALDDNLAERLPDIAWIHHSMLPKRVLENAADIVFLFHHMSSILAAEFTLDAALEVELATAVLFESPKSLDVHRATGVYDDVESERLQVMGNPAAQGFAVDREQSAARRVLVVSNHIPEELVDAVAGLRERFEVVLVGAQTELGAAPQRVTPDLITSADAVISIGKTVQYSMVSGTPVYVYDHFGGPGWLTVDNLEETSYENFSGRGFNRKTASTIIQEVSSGIEAAWGDAQDLREVALARYTLAGRIGRLLSYAAEHPRAVSAIDTQRIMGHELMQQAFGVYVREWVRMQRDRDLLEGELTELRGRNDNIERDYVRVTTKPLVKVALKLSKN
ncbi:hypothetical protein ACL9RL_02165 [Plantibacter sp. Mn2098]|uniref:hypothetical protein n=1 Tax=Plantibacter sp. Mn2098 TaxID=3395266 RepID=UPI003BD5075B